VAFSNEINNRYLRWKFVRAELDHVKHRLSDGVGKGTELVVVDVKQSQLFHKLDGEGDSGDFVVAHVKI
jgi:hypothetical protein